MPIRGGATVTLVGAEKAITLADLRLKGHQRVFLRVLEGERGRRRR